MMPRSTKPQLAKAAHDAAHEVENMHGAAHAEMLKSGILPPGIAAFLKLLVADSPQIAAAILALIGGTPAAATPAPGMPGTPATPAQPTGA